MLDPNLVRIVAQGLLDIQTEFGEKRFKILRNRHEGLEIFREFNYINAGTFAANDESGLKQAKNLAENHRRVLVVATAGGDGFELWVPSDSSDSSQPANKSGCFIATAVYGSPSAPEVLIFRRFRDEVLLPSKFGSSVVGLYYAFSPFLAALLSKTQFLRDVSKYLLLVPALWLIKVLRRDRS